VLFRSQEGGGSIRLCAGGGETCAANVEHLGGGAAPLFEVGGGQRILRGGEGGAERGGPLRSARSDREKGGILSILGGGGGGGANLRVAISCRLLSAFP